MSRKIRTRARAEAGSHEWGIASTGTEQVGVRVVAIGGDLDGQSFTWYGSFTELSEDRTLDSLRFAGWDGTDLINLPGLGSTEFDLQLEEVDDDRGITHLRPTFINRIGVAMKNPMTDAQKRAFANRMKSKIGSAGSAATARATKSSAPGADDFDDVPF